MDAEIHLVQVAVPSCERAGTVGKDGLNVGLAVGAFILSGMESACRGPGKAAYAALIVLILICRAVGVRF